MQENKQDNRKRTGQILGRDEWNAGGTQMGCGWNVVGTQKQQTTRQKDQSMHSDKRNEEQLGEIGRERN